MRVALTRKQRIVVDEIPPPQPQAGEVLVRTLACGICGSDLHMLVHAERLIESARQAGSALAFNPRADTVYGHEFAAEILEFGPDCERRLELGSRVTSVPIGVRDGQVQTVGYSNQLPGGYGELMVLRESLLLELPAGVTPAQAALTEPLAVGLHAVEQSALTLDHTAIVVGCGPIGLAVIAALKLRGIQRIVASDFSERRRALALEFGASCAVDPQSESPYESWEELARLPFPAPNLFPGLVADVPARSPLVLFECVGVPGVLAEMVRQAPSGAQIVVVGVCMEPESFEPADAINRQLELKFVLGYSPSEFAATLQHIASARLPTEALITARVTLDEVAGAFEELGTPEEHAKIVIEPWR